jgi:ketosteroid isomerase-like protein
MLTSFACAVALGLCAALGPGPGPAPADAIKTILQGTADAWNRGDFDGHVAPYDAASTFMIKGPAPREKMVEFLRAYYFKDGKPLQSLRYDNVDVRMLGDSHALVTGRFVLSGGDKPERDGWFTLVWVRRPDGWKILHDHSS